MDRTSLTLSEIGREHLHAQVARELIIAIYRRLPVIILVECLLAPAIIVSLLWEVATALQMVQWLLVHFLVTGVHGYAYLRFRRPLEDSTELRKRLLAAGMLLRGLYWGALLSLMFHVMPELFHHLYLFLYVGALGVLAVALMSEDLRTMAAFSLPPLAMLSASAFARQEPKYLLLGAFGVAAAGAIVLYARTRHRGDVEALEMRFAIAQLAIELRDQREVAEQANVAKSKFLAAASHDLRQPLHALSLLAAALESCDLNDRARAITSDINTAIDGLETLFTSLLDVSRLDAGALEVQPKHFELGPMLRRLATEYTPQARSKGLHLTVFESTCVLHTDPVLLERVVRNYLTNAVRYTEKGEVSVSVQSTDHGARIRVADTGMGIAPEQHAQIFNEFYQVGNKERSREAGLGLGLAIVRRIAHLLEHPIGVESALGQGSCFHITVPAGDPSCVEPAPPEMDLHRDFHGLRVLIIDDDVLARDSMCTLLDLWGCSVVAAESASTGLRLARATYLRPDAMIVDLSLGHGMTGREVIAQLRADFGFDVPALIVSGDTAVERLQEMLRSGHTFLHKPVQPVALGAFLRSAIRARSAAA